MRDDDIIGYRCPACKMLNAKNVKYCVECGHWLLDTTFPAEVVKKSDYLKQINVQANSSADGLFNTNSLKNINIDSNVKIVIGFIAAILVFALIKYSFGDVLKNQTPKIGNTTKNSNSILSLKDFDKSVQPLPENGAIWQYTKSECIAPLGIITKSNDTSFFVKLNDWNTKQTAMEIFIRAGQTVNTKIPLGSYEIKYAAGKTWYGKQYYFGAETSYKKADEKFDFFKNENSIRGYTLELYQTANGNLRSQQISSSEF
jgi:hypothetical protein